MKIPFVPKNITIPKDRFDFIQQYRGGGFMLISGAIYWLLAFALTYIINGDILNNFYIWGGLLVPILGFICFKVFHLKVISSSYSSLVAFASTITVCCFPILLLIKQLNPFMILPVLCIINATHLLILCWVYLDYLYAIMLMIGEFIGIAFIFSIPQQYVHFLCLIWGIISFVVGIIIHISSKMPLKGYNCKIVDLTK